MPSGRLLFCRDDGLHKGEQCHVMISARLVIPGCMRIWATVGRKEEKKDGSLSLFSSREFFTTSNTITIWKEGNSK